MSRSRRLPIYKDNGYMKPLYSKTIRRVVKHAFNRKYNKNVYIGEESLYEYGDDVINIPNPKSIINDYSYSDYRMIFYKDDDFYNIMTRK